MNLGKNKMKMSSKSAKFTISALTIGMLALSQSVMAENAQITNLSSSQSGENSAELRFSFAGQPVMPEAYQFGDRLILDFKSVSSTLPDQTKNLSNGVVNSAQTLVNGDNTRVILGLSSDAKYTSFLDGQDLILSVSSGTASTGSPVNVSANSNSVNNNIVTTTPVGQPSFQPTNEEMVVKVNPLLAPSIHSTYISKKYSYDGLNSVDYSGNGQGGTVSIGLANESIPVDVSRQGNKIVVRMTGSTVPKHLLSRMNVNSALVSNIDATNRGKSGIVTINMKNDFEYQAYQTGNNLSISVTPAKIITPPSLEKKVYSGEPLSMEFQDLSIRTVLQVLAEHTDMNIVAADNVSGNITLRLINVPWDQALDIVLESKGLGKVVNGNVILIKPEAEIVADRIKKLENLKKEKGLDPVRTEYIRLSYANAKNVFKLISEARNSGGGASGNKNDSGSLLSVQGSISVDERTNTLIVKDTSASIENIRALISKIDIPVKQIMIEARIVSATDNFSKDIGVKWGVLSNGAATNDTLLVGGSDQALWDLKEFDIETKTINGQKVSYPKYEITRPNNLNVDLGAANPSGSIAFSLLTMSDLMLDLELSAMQADNKGEVISTPKILTADKQKAKISSGTQIPYEAVSSDGTDTDFKDAGLSLEVTPNITPDGKIGLDLNIKNGSPTIINNKIAISSDEIQTNVLVEDGQTIVLGGVFKNTSGNGVKKVPFLGDLPYVGKLFRNDTRYNNKQELLIFITTRVVNDGVSRF